MLPDGTYPFDYYRVLACLNRQSEEDEKSWKKYWEREARDSACVDCEEKDILIKELETRIKYLKILRRTPGRSK